MREAPEFFGATKGPCQAQDRTCGSWFWASASPWQAILFADLKATQEAFWVYTMVELAWGVATSVLKENAATFFLPHGRQCALLHWSGSSSWLSLCSWHCDLAKECIFTLVVAWQGRFGVWDCWEFHLQSSEGKLKQGIYDYMRCQTRKVPKRPLVCSRIQIRDGFCWAKILYSILVSELKSTFFSANVLLPLCCMLESCLFEFWLEQRVADLRIVGVGGVSTCRGQRRFAMGHSTVNRAYQCKWDAQQLVVCEENECDCDSGAYVKPSSNVYTPFGFTSNSVLSYTLLCTGPGKPRVPRKLPLR